MDDDYSQFEQPLQKKSTIDEIKHNLRLWRDTLRNEVDTLIVMKNEVLAKKITIKVKEKHTEVIDQLLTLCFKAVECIREYLSHLEDHRIVEVNNKIYTKTEYIRVRYTEILLNIRKMISKSSLLGEIRDNYYRTKNMQDENNGEIIHFPKEGENREVIKNNTRKTQNGGKCECTAKRACDNLSREEENDEENIKRQEKPHKITLPSDVEDNRICNTKKKSTSASIHSLSQELLQLQDICRDIKKSIAEHCITDNERKTFEKIKKDTKELDADVNHIKDDMKELMENYQELIKRVSSLEEEKAKLKKENTNLQSLVEGKRSSTGKIKSDKITEKKSIGKYNSSTPMAHITNSTPLITDQNISTFEMMSNINNNLERNTTSRRRFLIPKC